MNEKRVKVTRVTVEFEYADGTKKEVDIDPQENEALFWSERSVTQMLAPFYEKHRKDLSVKESVEFARELGRQVSAVTPEIVIELWNTPIDRCQATTELPGAIRKPIKCIPTVPCKTCQV
ncbi:MAG: hypothetical protein AABY49_13270 [Planctomycetota bacterium]